MVFTFTTIMSLICNLMSNAFCFQKFIQRVLRMVHEASSVNEKKAWQKITKISGKYQQSPPQKISYRLQFSFYSSRKFPLRFKFKINSILWRTIYIWIFQYRVRVSIEWHFPLIKTVFQLEAFALTGTSNRTCLSVFALWAKLIGQKIEICKNVHENWISAIVSPVGRNVELDYFAIWLKFEITYIDLPIRRILNIQFRHSRRRPVVTSWPNKTQYHQIDHNIGHNKTQNTRQIRESNDSFPALNDFCFQTFVSLNWKTLECVFFFHFIHKVFGSFLGNVCLKFQCKLHNFRILCHYVFRQHF